MPTEYSTTRPSPPRYQPQPPMQATRPPPPVPNRRRPDVGYSSWERQTSNSTQVPSGDAVIAIMGATGSGKSTFINLASGSNMAVGEGLKSCTATVDTAHSFELFGRNVILVDTPGFDDTIMSDADILKIISAYLSTSYERGQVPSGIIYMHRISDTRLGGIARRNFKLFQKLCGEAAMRNVAIVTNMWNEVDPAVGQAREKELMEDPDLFKSAFDMGARAYRHNNTVQSAQNILRQMLANRPRPLRIQQELVEERKDIMQTDAGLELNRELSEMARKQREELAELEHELAEALAAKDMQAKKELAEERSRLMLNLEKLERDRTHISQDFVDEKRRAEAKIRELATSFTKERSRAGERRPNTPAPTPNFPTVHGRSSDQSQSRTRKDAGASRSPAYSAATEGTTQKDVPARQDAGRGAVPEDAAVYPDLSQARSVHDKFRTAVTALAEETKRRKEKEQEADAYRQMLAEQVRSSDQERRQWQRTVDDMMTQRKSQAGPFARIGRFIDSLFGY